MVVYKVESVRFLFTNANMNGFLKVNQTVSSLHDQQLIRHFIILCVTDRIIEFESSYFVTLKFTMDYRESMKMAQEWRVGK